MALILDDDGLLDAADGFAGWDDALADDMLAQELELERAVELESELEQDERPIDYDAELEDAEEEAAPTTKTCGAMYRWNIRRCRSRRSCLAG